MAARAPAHHPLNISDGSWQTSNPLTRSDAGMTACRPLNRGPLCNKRPHRACVLEQPPRPLSSAKINIISAAAPEHFLQSSSPCAVQAEETPECLFYLDSLFGTDNIHRRGAKGTSSNKHEAARKGHRENQPERHFNYFFF